MNILKMGYPEVFWNERDKVHDSQPQLLEAIRFVDYGVSYVKVYYFNKTSSNTGNKAAREENNCTVKIG